MNDTREQTALIRADGSTMLGHGHVFRTLVLAEELRNHGWKVVYVCRDLDGAPLSRIRDAGHGLVMLGSNIDEDEDEKATAGAAREAGASWIVVDRYATCEQAHALWRAGGFKVLAIDDICEHSFDVDILLNQNTDAADLPYRTRAETVRLFGPRYALVRPAYRKARPAAPRVIGEVRRVMVFMGGGDPGDATGKVVEALGSISQKIEVDVIVGAANPHLKRLERLSEASHHRVRVLRDLTDLVEPMSRADVAIIAGGSVTWELCCMGVPMLLLPIADNQEGIAQSMPSRGAAIRVGRAETIEVSTLAREIGARLADTDGMSRMSHESFSLVDGEGASRVAGGMCLECNGTRERASRRLRVREAVDGDMRLFWEWANDKDVRANSFVMDSIPWEDHVAWFSRKLVSTECLMFVALDESNEPVGQIRFDVDNDEAELNYSLDRKARGMGYGVELIEAGVEALFRTRSIERILAHVKVKNEPSQKAILRANFKQLADDSYRGNICACFGLRGRRSFDEGKENL